MKHTRFTATFIVLIAFSFLLSGCAGDRGTLKTVSSSYGGKAHYKVGRPYKIKGEWYHPREDYRYDETGLASWYGGNFHNKLTANGEIYNKYELTAAHKTLQMPSLARVTNLENGRSIVVRINDRGPYVAGRIIDLSQRGSQLLGFEKQGVAKVRVQVLTDESKAIAQAMQTYGSAPTPTIQPQRIEQAVYKPVVIEAAPLPPKIESVEPTPLRQPPPVQRVEPQELPTMETVKPVAHYTQFPVTDETNLYVQAGSFANKGNALRLQERLSDLGDVAVTKVIVRGSLFYRVRVGPLETVLDADDMLARVYDAGIEGARIFVAD